MKDIYILGSGGFAKEVYFLITEINKAYNKYGFKGFIDLNPAPSQLKIGGVIFPVYEEDIFFLENAGKAFCLTIGIGDPKIIRKLADKYSGLFEFPNLVHPDIVINRATLQLGLGNIITFNCVITVDIKIGDFNVINFSSSIGHDTVIGSFNVINPSVNVSGGVIIGNGNLIGVNATILQYLTIGSNSVLGASSLLTKNLDSNKLAFGVPAKVVKDII